MFALRTVPPFLAPPRTPCSQDLAVPYYTSVIQWGHRVLAAPCSTASKPIVAVHRPGHCGCFTDKWRDKGGLTKGPCDAADADADLRDGAPAPEGRAAGVAEGPRDLVGKGHGSKTESVRVMFEELHALPWTRVDVHINHAMAHERIVLKSGAGDKGLHKIVHHVVDNFVF